MSKKKKKKVELSNNNTQKNRSAFFSHMSLILIPLTNTGLILEKTLLEIHDLTLVFSREVTESCNDRYHEIAIRNKSEAKGPRIVIQSTRTN